MNYLSGGRWLDGPKVVAWLRERIGQTPAWNQEDELAWARKVLGPTFVRRLSEWNRGGSVDIYALDRFLCGLCLHPSEIPDECWLEQRVYRTHCCNGHRLTDETIYVSPKGKRECRVCRASKRRRVAA